MTAMLFNRMGRGIAAALILSALAIGPARGDNGTIFSIR
jgi:hypothetical protein